MFVAVVETDRPSSESAYSIASGERERVARLRVERRAPGRRGSARARRPSSRPSGRGRGSRSACSSSVERELVAPSVELVGAVLDPVRPRDQHLPAAGRDLSVGGVAVEQLAAARRVRAQPAADLDDDGALVAAGRSRSAHRTARTRLPRHRADGPVPGRRARRRRTRAPSPRRRAPRSRRSWAARRRGRAAGRRRRPRCRSRAGRRRSRHRRPPPRPRPAPSGRS